MEQEKRNYDMVIETPTFSGPGGIEGAVHRKVEEIMSTQAEQLEDMIRRIVREEIAAHEERLETVVIAKGVVDGINGRGRRPLPI